MLRVSEPILDNYELDYVSDAVKRSMLSGHVGDYIARFENEFSSYCDCNYGIACTSGTTALHLAVAALGIGAGDEVLVSTYTNMATCFAIMYQGAKPVPIDICEDTWNLNPELLEQAITEKTKAIIVVHAFGHPVDMDPVREIAKKNNLFVVEDAAQAHGALYKDQKIGSLSDVACFSFYANKIITTGEGGMVVTNNESIGKKAESFRNLCYGDVNKFMHKDIGFNYRMSNLNAAIGCAQLKKIDDVIERKRSIAKQYNELFDSMNCLQLPVERDGVRNVFWMYHIVLKENISIEADPVISAMRDENIETRPGFVPINMQTVLVEKGLVDYDACPVANAVSARSFYIPSGPTLTADQLTLVSEKLINVINKLG